MRCSLTPVRWKVVNSCQTPTTSQRLDGNFKAVSDPADSALVSLFSIHLYFNLLLQTCANFSTFLNSNARLEDETFG